MVHFIRIKHVARRFRRGLRQPARTYFYSKIMDQFAGALSLNMCTRAYRNIYIRSICYTISRHRAIEREGERVGVRVGRRAEGCGGSARRRRRQRTMWPGGLWVGRNERATRRESLHHLPLRAQQHATLIRCMMSHTQFIYRYTCVAHVYTGIPPVGCANRSTLTHTHTCRPTAATATPAAAAAGVLGWSVIKQ